MPTATIAGVDVVVDDEGYLVDPSQWSRDIAEAIARDEGIEHLGPDHWKVVEFMRSEYFTKGECPTVRTLGKASGVSVKQLYELFPGGPAKVAARIAGTPKPRGCI